MTLDLIADSISEEQLRQRAVLHATKKVGGKDAPVNYSFEERVFSSKDTPSDKALAKQEVLESLKSRILSSEKPGWNMSTSNYDNMQMTGKCYKRTNVNAERNRTNIMWREEDTGYWMRYAAPVPSTRFNVIKLQEEMDNKLMKRQARENGICPVHEDIYRQCFDELIREVAINCPERRLLLLRVRDEVRLTTDAYKTLYDSSITFGIRKQLQAEDGMGDLQDRMDKLQREKQEHEAKVAELTNRLELIGKRATERKALQDKKFKEELDFLKY
ncbi:Axonemal dynein light chain, partial [Globisporangium splendens]